MIEYSATIEWNRDNQVFSDSKYSRVHTWSFENGQTITASSSPNIVPTPYSDPRCLDPEESFVAALSSCHMLFFLSIVAGKGYVVDNYSDSAIGLLEKNSESQLAITQVTLNPKVDFASEFEIEQEELERIHDEAHKLCFIANSVNTTITIDIQT